jgi:hypothetical protein
MCPYDMGRLAARDEFTIGAYNVARSTRYQAAHEGKARKREGEVILSRILRIERTQMMFLSDVLPMSV